MADVVITLKVMPNSPDVDRESLKEHISKLISDFGADLGKVEEEPIAFGLVAIKFIIVMDEEKGSTDSLEAQMEALEGVQSAELTTITRAMG